MRYVLKFCLIGALGCCLGSLAHATTIDTFSVTQSWGVPNSGGVTGTASGTFTGIVGGHGEINQADLSNFSFSYTFATEHLTYSQSQLSLFSFNAGSFLSSGFAGSLDLVATTNAMNGSSSPAAETLCIGAVAGEGFGPCAADPPFSTVGSVTLFGNSMDFTSESPSITLVSSITTMPGPTVGQRPPSAVPEPATLSLFALGAIGLVALGKRL
ncbi:MAG TPA: PEP-CTERM sorting domain-containing protein [Terriglobia bacterium]|nr:PEP-CTERM sorting domain-containing protein [Terriglobia bacterium]